MAEITHHKAQVFLQAAADRSLELADRSALDAHLQACKECRIYADRLEGLEASLRKAFHTRWDRYRPNLNLQAIKNPSPAKLIWNALFNQTQTLGKVSIMAALLVAYVVIVNIAGVRTPITDNETPTVLPTPNGFISNSATSPTPQIPTSLTGVTVQACKTIFYVVQANDTLESIAIRHGVTKEAILEYNPGDNNLAANTLFTGMELVIPQCESTPSRTASVPGNTLTITPLNGTILPEQRE
jgi:LysM repeat protein